MPASFKNRSGESALTATLRFTKAASQPVEADLRYAAERQRSRIIQRTGAGVDVDGKVFQGYTGAYAKKKAKTGRNSGKVDLTWSGRMLQGLVTRMGQATSFRIGVYGEEAARAAAHNAGQGHMPLRRFIAASDSDKQAMAADITARMQARANGKPLN